MKNPWVIIGIITVVLFGGAIWYSQGTSAVYNEGVEIISHSKGDTESSVVLTEYSDFQCPACAAFQPALDDLLEQYGDSLLFEYKHFPLISIHPHAQPAAIAAEAAGQQGKFFEFHDLLFENQQTWSAAAIPTTFFVQYAEQLELDIDEFRRHLRSSVLRDKVRAEFEEARTLGLTGTPSFLLNGEIMRFDSYESFFEQIAVTIDPTSVGTSTSTTGGGEVRFGI